MARLKGVTVILHVRMSQGNDPIGAPIYNYQPVQVANVLISPVHGQDALTQMNLDGRKAVYTLAIPKGDANDWEGARVDFFGENWRVIGVPIQGIDALIPLGWNKKVTVERYE